MRILVTGAFGLLGGRLAQYLAAQPDVQVLLGTRQEVSAASWLPGATVVRTPWNTADDLGPLCTKVDAIVHVARMNAQDCAANPVAALEFNAVATARLLMAAAAQGVQRFVYVSTAHVYGSPLQGLITEATPAVSLHPYATSHRAGEDVVRSASFRKEIEGVVIRLSNSFGVPTHKEVNCWMLLIPDLCRQAVTMRRMALQSSGLQRRNFLPMPDACRAIAHLLQVPMSALSGDVVNVGGDWTPAVWEVATLIQSRCESVLGFRPELTRIEPAQGETSADLQYRCDVLRNSGFRPVTDQVEEIDRLLMFCRTAFA